MADRKQDFGAGAEAHARFKQYDYRAVSCVGTVLWVVEQRAGAARQQRASVITAALDVFYGGLLVNSCSTKRVQQRVMQQAGSADAGLMASC